jgi:GT2 family glycosyltransferase
MAYYNRPELLRNTLWAYRHLHDDLSRFEFVIVDDGSDPGLGADKVVEEFSDSLDAKVFRRTDKRGHNPAVPINASVQKASADIIVITNPEALPLTPVLNAVEQSAPSISGAYLVSACYSLSESSQRVIDALDPTDPSFIESISKGIRLIPRAATFDGDDGWYEHPAFLSRGLYFFAAMPRKDFIAMGGIDEDFQEGSAWEDTDFIRRLVQRNTRMGYLEGAACLHQHHYTKPASTRPHDWSSHDNKALFEQKARRGRTQANEGRRWGRL